LEEIYDWIEIILTIVSSVSSVSAVVLYYFDKKKRRIKQELKDLRSELEKIDIDVIDGNIGKVIMRTEPYTGEVISNLPPLTNYKYLSQHFNDKSYQNIRQKIKYIDEMIPIFNRKVESFADNINKHIKREIVVIDSRVNKDTVENMKTILYLILYSDMNKKDIEKSLMVSNDKLRFNNAITLLHNPTNKDIEFFSEFFIETKNKFKNKYLQLKKNKETLMMKIGEIKNIIDEYINER